MARLQRYSHHARRALTHATNLASQYQHPHLDTVHLLVGVIITEGCVGSRVMAEFDLPPDVAEVYLKRIVRPVEEASAQIPRHDSFDKALDFADDEANWLGHHYIGTEHLLLGITRVNVGNAINLLRLVDITPEQIRRRVRLVLSDGLKEFSLETARRQARLSELTKRVLSGAEQLSLAMDHPTIGIGHLLLSLLREKRGVTSAILLKSGLDESRLLRGINNRETSFLVSIEVLLDAATDQAENLGSHYIGTDHLLLAMTQTPVGTIMLQRYGAAPDKVKRLLYKSLRRD